MFYLMTFLLFQVFIRMIYSISRTTVDPEIYMNTTELIRSKGYPCNEYQVVTEDGYILDIQRIPHGRKQHLNSRVPPPVVLIQHGLLSSSACWVENLANESLGFILADEGYDVWLGNSRGNTYGMKHKTLSPDQEEFWRFSWDEMASLDLSATVDTILNVTGQSSIFYVGHSQGAEIAFAALSNNAELTRKIRLLIALAPAVYLGHLESPIRYLSDLSTNLLYDLLGRKDFLPDSNFIRWIGKEVCGKKIPGFLCEEVLFLFGGYDAKEMNESRIPVYTGHNPAGTSVQNLIHYAQAVRTGHFQMFDFGPEVNMKKYKQTTPPKYNISNIKTKTALFSGTADWLVVPVDVARVAKELNTLVEHIVIQDWEHLDFIWAMQAPSLCYKYVTELLGKFV